MKKALIGTPNIVKCAKFPNRSAPNSQMKMRQIPKWANKSLVISVVILIFAYELVVLGTCC